MEMDLNQKIEAIKADHTKTFEVTPYEVVHHYGWSRRSWNNTQIICNDLAEQELELCGDLYQEYFYAPMVLRHKKVATTKIVTDPVKRVGRMAAANHAPVCVKKEDTLLHAITIMQQYGYSRLPVVDSSARKLYGHISWKTIGLALWHGKECSLVQDCLSKDAASIDRHTPLLEAIPLIADKGFVVVRKEDQTFSGIITSADIAKEFFSITQAEAFLLLEQIELQIRIMIGKAGILLEDLKKVCQDPLREINSVDDLTFGEYVQIISAEDNWSKFNIKNERKDFVKFLDKVREIRNDVMHFEPEGISGEKMNDLRNMARYLREMI